MDWIFQNWVWMLFFVAFIAMHIFGHGGHGGHGRRSRSDRVDEGAPSEGEQVARTQTTGHQH